MTFEGMQEPELLGRAQDNLRSLLWVEQDTGVESSFSDFGPRSQR